MANGTSDRKPRKKTVSTKAKAKKVTKRAKKGN